MRLPQKKILGLIGFGLGMYLLFLIALFPAALGWQWLPPALKQQVNLQGISGSIWSGRVAIATVNGYESGPLRWQLSPFSLLLGHLGIDAQIKIPAGRIQGRFTIISDTEFEAEDVSGELLADAISALSIRQLPVPVMLRGKMKPEIKSLRFHKGQTLQIQGEVKWLNASVEGVQSFPLGVVELKAEPKKQGSRITIRNNGGALELSGNLQLNGNGSYQLNLGLLNRDNQRQDLKTMLSMLGTPDATGRVHFRYNGKLPIR